MLYHHDPPLVYETWKHWFIKLFFLLPEPVDDGIIVNSYEDLVRKHVVRLTFEPVREKTKQFGFQPGSTQIRLYSHKRWLEAWNFGFKKKRGCTIRVAKAKIKALISFAVTAKLICDFVFAYADCWFSHAAAHFICLIFRAQLFNINDVVR